MVLETPRDLFNSGVAARAAGDVAEARRLFKEAAGKGHPKATHNLAVMVEDPAVACRLFRSAAFKGLAESQYALGMHLVEGHGVAADPVEGARHLERAAMAAPQQKGEKQYQNQQKGEKAEKGEKGKGGHPKAHFELACLLDNGVVAATDLALPLPRSSEVDGEGKTEPGGGADGEGEQHQHQHQQQGQHSTEEAALRHYEAAAEGGELRACVNLGRLLEKEGNPRARRLRALHWYKVASDRGDATAAFNLAMCHSVGEEAGGVEPDAGKAISYLEVATARGHLKAMFNLACRKLKGGADYNGLPKDLPGCIELLSLAAEGGDDRAAAALRRVTRHQRDVAERRRILLASDEAARAAAEAAEAEALTPVKEAATPSEIAMMRMRQTVARNMSGGGGGGGAGGGATAGADDDANGGSDGIGNEMVEYGQGESIRRAGRGGFRALPDDGHVEGPGSYGPE